MKTESVSAMRKQERTDDKINVLARAFSVLEQFNLADHEISISDLKKRLGLPLSTLHRILSTLHELGYINQNKETGKYCLGYKIAVLGSMVQSSNELKRVAGPFLSELAEKYKEMVHLSIVERGELFCLDRIDDLEHSIVFIPNYNKAHNIFASSAGKSIMAFTEKTALEKKIANADLLALTPNTIVNKDLLRKELDSVRANGYALDREELELGLNCIGAPVFDLSGACVAAVSISMPSIRFPQDYKDLIADVKETARRISIKLGASIR